MVTGFGKIFPALFAVAPQPSKPLAASYPPQASHTMKHDFSFKLVAAIIIAGVVVAFVSPSHATHKSTGAAAVAVTSEGTE